MCEGNISRVKILFLFIFNSIFYSTFCVKEYYSDVRVFVEKITPRSLGREMVGCCGNEGNHENLDEEGQITLKFFRVAISFIEQAENDGADMRNAAFIFQQPFSERLIQSGKGDWEYLFLEDPQCNIHGRCVRKPLMRYIYDKVKGIIKAVGKTIFKSIETNTMKALTGPSP